MGERGVRGARPIFHFFMQFWGFEQWSITIYIFYIGGSCCDMGQNDTIGKIELNPSIVLSSDNTNCKNDIQLFHQLFDEPSVSRDYH